LRGIGTRAGRLIGRGIARGVVINRNRIEGQKDTELKPTRRRYMQGNTKRSGAKLDEKQEDREKR